MNVFATLAVCSKRQWQDLKNQQPMPWSLGVLSYVLLAVVSCSPAIAPYSNEDMAAFLSAHPKPLSGRTEKIKSNMHDLIISWISLPKVEASGGALFPFHELLIVIQPTGELLWVNTTKFQGPYSTEIKAPMNRTELISTGLANRTSMNLGWFRAAGAYAEPVRAALRLFVVHHVFEDDCFSLQVSAVDLIFDVKAGIKQGSDWQRIFRPTPCIHIGDASDKPFAGHQAGGRIISLDSDHLLVSYGDHEIDGVNSANSPQDPNSPYGKIWKIAKDGSSAEVYAMGVKNPQGLLFDSGDGLIWESEHGPQGGDELNLIRKDKNYGYPIQTYGVMYDDYEWPLNPSQGRHSSGEYELPIFAWVPSIGTSNLTKVAGPKFPLWAGDLLLATLSDKSIHRLRIIGDRVIYDERITIGQRLRDIVSLDNGKIAVLSDNAMIGLIDDPGPKLKPLAASPRGQRHP